MMEVAAAREIVLEHAGALPAEFTAVMSSSLGQLTAADVLADLDSPPFDQAAIDGYAVNAADLPGGFGELRVSGQIAAGPASTAVLHTATAIRIFAGAPIPNGANAIVMAERTALNGSQLLVNDPDVAPGKHILRRGSAMKAGDVAMPTGTRLSPAAFGILAMVGKTSVLAIPQPRVTVVAAGNELVEPNRTPRAGQTRNCNGPMLVGQVARAGGLPRYLGIATDDEAALRSFIGEGLEISQIVIVAGASAAKPELLPKVLADLGVRVHFQAVRMKPGQPLLFGSREGVLVFGLPGDPVSAFVAFELFVRPAMAKLAGHRVGEMKMLKLPLTAALAANHDRPTYHPAMLGIESVTPLPWHGSADLRAMLNADAFILLPPGAVNYAAGSRVDVIPIEA